MESKNTLAILAIALLVCLLYGCTDKQEKYGHELRIQVLEEENEALRQELKELRKSARSEINSDSSTSTESKPAATSFTNQYGTPTTVCNHDGCNSYIASSGDTNCCTSHSQKCADCGKYIDEDAFLCMDCITGALS